jgi:hypothetical protein
MDKIAYEQHVIKAVMKGLAVDIFFTRTSRVTWSLWFTFPPPVSIGSEKLLRKS